MLGRHSGGMNELSAFRRLAATATIGSFSIAALMGIVALLGGGDFGESEGRVLLTTLVVGCASVCMLCYLATAGTRWATVGMGGAVVLIVPVVSSLLLIWSDWDGDSEGLWKLYGVGVVGAATLAQVCLLLALAGVRHRLAPVLWATVGLAVLVALLISGMILGEIEADEIWRLLGVAAILDVLGTLITTALAKFGGRDDRDGRRASGTPAELEAGRLTLTVSQAAAIDALAHATGRPPGELVAEAVDRYLREEASGSAPRSS